MKRLLKSTKTYTLAFKRLKPTRIGKGENKRRNRRKNEEGFFLLLLGLFIVGQIMSLIDETYNGTLELREILKPEVIKNRTLSSFETAVLYKTNIKISDINSLDLVKIKGIGPVTAEKIMKYSKSECLNFISKVRSEKEEPEFIDLRKIKGIGEKKANEISKFINFELTNSC